MNAAVDFSRLVKRIREVRGLTQEQLARDLEVTFGTVNAWENGKHQPIQALASRLLQVASASGIRADEKSGKAVKVARRPLGRRKRVR